jgi:hypothetical protein
MIDASAWPLVMDGGILDARLHHGDGDPRAYLVRFGYAPPPIDETADDAQPLDVEVNAGLWIWRCPCGLGSVDDPPIGGGIAFAATPLGWCARCQNVETVGRWRPLRFPPERLEIERVLAARPDPSTRNWWPGETVGELVAENVAHGIEGEP